MSTVVESSPAGLLALIVIVTVEGVTVVGVPIISPVDGSTDRPAGIVPAVIVQDVGAPAVYVGIAPLAGSFLVNVYGEFGYEIVEGASSRTLIVIVVELLSAELFAQIVNVTAEETTVVGVP
jgi:hypothetical protein